MNNQSNFIELKKCSRIWAIGSMHSNLNAFNSIKKFILNKFEENDKLVILGNVIGLGMQSKCHCCMTVDSLHSGCNTNQNEKSLGLIGIICNWCSLCHVIIFPNVLQSSEITASCQTCLHHVENVTKWQDTC